MTGYKHKTWSKNTVYEYVIPSTKRKKWFNSPISIGGEYVTSYYPPLYIK